MLLHRPTRKWNLVCQELGTLTRHLSRSASMRAAYYESQGTVYSDVRNKSQLQEELSQLLSYLKPKKDNYSIATTGDHPQYQSQKHEWKQVNKRTSYTLQAKSIHRVQEVPLYSASSAANHYDQHGQQDNGTVDWTMKTQDKQERTPLTGGRAQNKRANGTWVRTKLTSKKNTIKGYYSKPKTQWTKRVTLRAMTHRWNKRHTTLNPRHNDTGGLNNRERRSYPRHGRQHKPLYQPCTKQGKVRNIGRRTSTNRHTHVWNGISNI